jgi:hypothetical protein
MTRHFILGIFKKVYTIALLNRWQVEIIIAAGGAVLDTEPLKT